MKCPKCGSPRTGRDSALKRRCKNCNINIEQYQARLDKVLSKFAGTTNFLCYANFIVYSNEQFTIEFDYKYIKISLDTVESLIKDLEAQNEK